MVFDDNSSDRSLKILESYNKKIKIFKKKKKKFTSSPLNQIHGILELFKKSKGEIIFLLDGDDSFKRNKLPLVFNFFQKKTKI